MTDSPASLIQAFFAAFDNRSGPAPVDRLYELCLETVSIINATQRPHRAMGLAEFVEPRRVLLQAELVAFHEWEVEGRGVTFADTAVHVCLYEKAGVLHGEAFQGRGVKTFQLVRVEAGWRVASLVWEDERPGVSFGPECLLGAT